MPLVSSINAIGERCDREQTERDEKEQASEKRDQEAQHQNVHGTSLSTLILAMTTRQIISASPDRPTYFSLVLGRSLDPRGITARPS
jgi:hypothetical protein